MILPIIFQLLLNSATDKNRKIIIGLFSFLLLCVFVLRDYSVGRDIPGYTDVYERASLYDWFDSDWIYMESGYVFLMKLCNQIGLSFRVFMLLLYAIFIVPLGIYIYKSSKDLCLSLVIYICFQFFVFNMSAFRQTAAMGLCLIAFMIAHKNGKKAFLGFVLFVFLAMNIHKSALVFFPAYFLMRQRLTPRMVILYAGISVFAIIDRNGILRFFQDNEYTNYQFNDAITIGSTFALTLSVVIFSLFANKKQSNETSFINIKKNIFAKPSTIEMGLSNYANLLTCAILLMLAFSGSILMRAATFYQLSLLILVSNLLSAIEPGMKKIIRLGVVLLLFAIFYFTVLIPNQFDIVPYSIGKDIEFLN